MRRPSAHRSHSSEIGYRSPSENANEIGTATRSDIIPAPEQGTVRAGGICPPCTHGDHQRCQVAYCWGCRHLWPLGAEEREEVQS